MPGSLDPPLSDADRVRGPADAEFELVMYGDFECPFCQAAQGIVARVEKRLEGRLRIAFRHFPLDRHPLARDAAQAAETAHAEGRFWEMHDVLYAARGRLERPDLLKHAKKAGLDVARLQADLDARAHAATVEEHRASGERSGVTGTPAFFLDGVLHEGAFDAGSLVAALRRS